MADQSVTATQEAEVLVYQPNRMRQARRLASRAWQLPKFAVVLLLIVLVVPALFADVIAPYGPLEAPGGIRERLQPPVFAGGTSDHILGTDKTGRDMLSRILHGSRVSILISVIGIAIAGSVGVTLGVIAGFYGGKVDALIMRLVDVSLSIPPVLLALSLATALSPSFRTVIIVVGALLWSIYCRQVRGDTLLVMQQDYIDRARVAGASGNSHHVPARAAQHHQHPHSAGDAAGGFRHPSRGGLVVPGSRSLASNAGLGPDGGRWT